MTEGNPPPTPVNQPIPEDRRELQTLLSHYHGLLTTLIEALSPATPYKPLGPEMQELVNGLAADFPGTSVAFGQA